MDRAPRTIRSHGIDDGSAPDDAPILHGWKALAEAGVASGNPLTVFDEMKKRIEKAGFLNVQEKVSKIPYGTWPRHKIYKDAGACNKMHYLSGVDGWSTVSMDCGVVSSETWLLTLADLCFSGF